MGCQKDKLKYRPAFGCFFCKKCGVTAAKKKLLCKAKKVKKS